MQVYNYVVRDTSGQRIEGFKQAANVKDILSWLGEQGGTPISINEVAGKSDKAQAPASRKRIKSSDLAMLCWQLTIMIKGGIGVTGALESISKDIENMRLRYILSEVVQKLKKGETLTESVSAFPKVFKPIFCSMVLAGETSGSLPNVLKLLAQYYENRDKLTKKIKSAVAYPSFVFGFMILMVIIIMTFIVPRFTEIFDQFGGKLPAFTQAFINFNNAFVDNLVYIACIILSVVIGYILCFNTLTGHRILSRIALSVPLIGKLIRYTFVVFFSRTTAMLLAAGVPILDIFDIILPMIKNDLIKNAILRTREQIVAGSKISSSMASSGFFPNMVITMVETGEESGSLCDILGNVTEHYEQKVESTISTMLSLLEPIMIVTVGGIVLVVVLALYLPIFSMSKVAG